MVRLATWVFGSVIIPLPKKLNSSMRCEWSRLYGKLKYVNRLDLLWEHVRRKEIEIPEFVNDHDEDLEYRLMMDYGLETWRAITQGSMVHPR
uniref:CRAL-TRIO domain-containing protein n=1 Tax=Fagus sylvatica TaxID=28930 RepID=A0A2N9HAH2_FAGSY